ncbi:MAG: cysteine synthase family protein [Eubacterium sp.]|nr:cysteine synthase family protein [Eubacterium sp.]
MNTSILETIGATPLVKLNHFSPSPNVTLAAKVEGFNPSGSIKDRIALKMIETAEAQGILTKDKIIIEPTSGNTGIGLAMVGAVKGYAVEIVMSAAVSVERRKMIEAFGAKVTLTAADEGTDGAIRRVRELMAASPGKYFNPDQFSNPCNYQAHIDTTAREIWEQTEGKITHLAASLGTSGTLMGIARGLRAFNPDIKIIEAQPEPGHRIQGLKNMEEAIVPPIYDPSAADIRLMVESETAFAFARDIIKKEGIFVGMSSGAALWAACEVAKTLDNGLIVAVFSDRGEKYLSTELFDF